MTAPFPLTEIQYAYWVGRGPSFVLGNVAPHAYFELEGNRLDPELMAGAWRTVIARHPMLRAVVDSDGNQRVLDDVPPFEITVVDLRTVSTEERTARLDEIRAEMSTRVYTAADWPLFDLAITRLPEHDRLHISLDLLMVDLASVAVLFSEWTELCRDPGARLAPVEVTFRDYVLALQQTESSPRHRRAMDYWTGRAESLAPPPELPLAKSPASVHKPVFVHRQFNLDDESWQRFQLHARERGLTPTAVLATVFSEVLSRWSGLLRFTLNLTLFNRLPLLLTEYGAGRKKVHPDLSRVVGDFTSICLLEMDLGTGTTLVERARATQLQLQHDLRHRDASALHTLRERRRLGLSTGFETMPVVFTSGLGTVADLTAPRDYFGDITYRISQTPQVWLDHQVVDITGSLELSWDAVEELFPPGVLDDMFATYTGLVRRLADDAGAWDAELTVTLPATQIRERELANATTAPVPAGLLYEPFLARAAAHPDRDAVITTSGRVSYGELARQAAAVAHALAGQAGRDVLVGVCAHKSAEQISAAVGVMMAGSAYLPVNPALPELRRMQILEDGSAATAIVHAATRHHLKTMDAIDISALVPIGDADAGPAAPDDLAYVIYTSGSTGRPKGVMIEHRAALNTVVDINRRFGVTADDTLFAITDLGFDLSVYDIFGGLGVGARLVLPDQDRLNDAAHWAELMVEHGVTVWNSVPAQMQMLVEHIESGGDLPEDLRVIMLSGDWIPVDLPERIRTLWPEAQLYSLGGATEASIWSIYHPANELEPGAPSVPYGKPLANQTFHVLDERLDPAPVWVAGELYIGGSGLARGYWNDGDRTAASFITHPATGERLYRTGDYGRYLHDGSVQFLGRRDGQVKIGGHRIELGEIEALLQQHPAVDRAIAVKVVDPNLGPRIAGYVVASAHSDELHVTEHADPADVASRWQRTVSAAEITAPGPDGEQLLGTWAQLNALHARAAAIAMRALGLPCEVGATFDPTAAIRDAGVAARYERWLHRAATAMAAYGYLTRVDEQWIIARELPTQIGAELVADVRRVLEHGLGIDSDVTDWLLELCASLRGVLTQDLHSAELYANDKTPVVYSRLFGPTYHVATEAVRRLVQDLPDDRPLRILEVGAGYGSLTQHLLPELPDATEYTFTDISTYFLSRARDRFDAYPWMRYDLLDLDRSPQTQGFDGAGADLIVAASVLHDMRLIDRTLNHLRSMLAPGGMLLVVEQTTFHPWFDLTMGLQQGFDNFQDVALRHDHPLLDLAEWTNALARTGYERTEVLTRTGGPAAVGFDVFVAQGPAERRRFEPEALREFASARLPRYMVPARFTAIDEVPLNRTGKVDRAALASVGAKMAGRSRAARPPQTDRQHKLVEIWREVLGISQIDIADDFLEAGGDSLLAARLVASVQRAFGVTVPVSVALEHPTVEGFDAYLGQILKEES